MRTFAENQKLSLSSFFFFVIRVYNNYIFWKDINECD